jgi:hypothetical protein
VVIWFFISGVTLLKKGFEELKASFFFTNPVGLSYLGLSVDILV